MEISNYLFELESMIQEISISHIQNVLRLLEQVYHNDRRIFILGNGGSAATASHLALDLAKSTIIPGAPRLKAISLTDNVPLITAWSNDTAYENIFTRQLENLLEAGDAVIGISTSGNSLNVVNAIKFARDSHAFSIGLLGHEGGRLKDIVDVFVLAPGRSIEQEEDAHMIISHIITKFMREVMRSHVCSARF